MNGRAYYNEHDAYAAAWLRNLIAAGHIAPGDVDERSVSDVLPSDLRGYAQCHFFAGIGVWSYALRLAGWPDDRSVWTGSCPCQPFSAAGARGGFADERHLWPHWFHLVRECRPAVVFGEQVASRDGLDWLDLVQDDMEGEDYAFGAVDTSSALHGAPHIRQRLRWVAHRCVARLEGRDARALGHECETAERGSSPRWLADADGRDSSDRRLQRGGQHGQQPEDGLPVRRRDRRLGHNGGPELDRPGATNGFWRDADWLFCRDARWRPVEPGTSPLADAAPARVGRLRAYGNAVDAEATRGFVEAFMTDRPSSPPSLSGER